MFDYVRERPSLSYVQPSDPWLTRSCVNSLEKLLGRARVEAIYHQLKREPFDAQAFFRRALDAMQIEAPLNSERLAQVPASGPLVILANHPFGIVDGLILCDIATRLRPDFRILLHAMLCQDSDLAPRFLPIDFQPGRAALKNNIRSKKLALQSLRAHIPLLIFPSGMVSTATRFGFGQTRDAPWTTFAAKLIQHSQATVLPVYFHGRNSRKFHVASHVAEPLRMAMLMHEALNKCASRVPVDIGEPLEWRDLKNFSSRRTLTDYLYDQVNRVVPAKGASEGAASTVA